MIKDLQKLSERESDPIIESIQLLDKNDHYFFDYFKNLIRIRNILKTYNYSNKELKFILKDFIRIFLFKKLILKDNTIQKLIEINRVPRNIINQFESYINIDKSKLKDTIFRQNNINPLNNSELDKWIKKEFLIKVKKYYRGVFGYKVHARYATNDGNLKKGSRFEYTYSNLHWDYALNATPYVIYLSKVKKGDGEFKILKSSINFKQNLYLSSFDYFLSNKHGIKDSILSNRVGSHFNSKRKKEIENDMVHFAGDKGTSIFFAGRFILHCGGYPEINNKRVAIFLSHKNYIMAIINQLLNIIDFL